LTAALATVPEDDRWLIRLEGRVRYLPQAIGRAEAKLTRLRAEAVSIGLDPRSLETAHTNGDMIATEYLKRLGYFR
jgi:hypothetical protein